MTFHILLCEGKGQQRTPANVELVGNAMSEMENLIFHAKFKFYFLFAFRKFKSVKVFIELVIKVFFIFSWSACNTESPVAILTIIYQLPITT